MIRVAVAVVLLAVTASAYADQAETELRLKSAGVDDALRKEILLSIQRGSKWLAARQKANGSFPGRTTTLCGLALQHADVPEAQEAYRKSLSYILSGRNRLRERIYQNTYEGGFAALMLHAEGNRTAILKRLGKAFVHGEGGHGFWGYSNGILSGKGAGNLSTSQFAVLALWAAGRAGYDSSAGVWHRHVEYLLRTQTLDGSFGYGTSTTSYPTGTFMGLANLVVARGTLSRVLKPEDRETIDAAVREAEAALARDVPATIAAFRTGQLRDYYALYAMEKACIFLDREEVGGVRWYVDGARALIAAQVADGHWSGQDYRYWLYGSRSTSFKEPGRNAGGGAVRPPEPRSIGARDLEATAFALLFLLRSWETFHPSSPRSLSRPTSTPGAPSEPEADPEPVPAEPGKLPIADAASLLDDLEHQLKKPGKVATRLAVIRLVGDAYGRLDGPPADIDAWRKRAEKLLLTAFGRDAATAIAAAEVLGRTHPRVVPEMTRIADKVLFPRARRAKDETIYAPVFDALAELDSGDALEWMLDRHMVSTGAPHSTPRCRAALRASNRFRSVPGKLRLAIVARLVKGYLGTEQPVTRPPWQLTGRWKELGPDVIRTTQHFARDPDGIPPTSRQPTGGWIHSMREFEEWLRHHDDPRKAPWR